MKTSVLVAVGALLVGGAGGYLVGTSGQEKEETTREDSALSKTTRSAARPGSATSVAPGRSGKGASSLREVLAEPGQTNRIMSLLQYYSDLDPSEFESEMQKLQGLPMSQRMLAMNLLFARWAETDPRAALEQSRSMGFPEMFMARAGAVSGWAASDPEGLAKQYTDNPGDFRMGGRGGRGGGDTVGMIAGEWAKQNPKAALAWARTLDERERDNAIAGVFNELAQRDPKEALSMTADLSAEERLDAYRSIAESWAISDYAAADRWISSLSGDEQASARVEAVGALANIDPKKAAGEALKMPDGEQRDDLVADVSRQWARQDPSSALAWLTTSGGEGAVEEGIGRVIGSLAREDSAKALEWIGDQPEGQVRDSAVQGYIFGNREAQASQTIGLAETISNEEQRTRAVQRVAYQWIRQDSDAAMSYVTSSTVLSDESKQRMTSMAERIAEGGDRGGDRNSGRFGGRGRGGR